MSNHGGRQLDGALSSIRALPPIADAVQGDIKILLDSGIRTGLDIVRAIALGADAVVIGRAWVYGLAAQKKQGVTNVLEILGNELRVAMALSGCPSLKDITPEILVK